jgi:glutathione S-transferase
MSTPRLYHLVPSRSTRVCWALEEIGAPYELEVMEAGDRHTDEHRRRHPLGRVPVIEEDDGSFLFESAAIILALADRHPDAGLNHPLGTRERELVYQWVLFAETEIEPYVVIARNERERDPERSAEAADRAATAVTVADEALGEREYIVGERLSAADIVLGAILEFARRQGTVRDAPNVERYVDALMARPAFVRGYASRT